MPEPTLLLMVARSEERRVVAALVLTANGSPTSLMTEEDEAVEGSGALRGVARGVWSACGVEVMSAPETIEAERVVPNDRVEAGRLCSSSEARAATQSGHWVV